MARSDSMPSVANLDAARRRLATISDAELLHRLLNTHGAIVGAGLDLQRVAAVVMRHVQELTHSSGAVIELLDGEELVYWAASGSVESTVAPLATVHPDPAGGEFVSDSYNWFVD